MGWPAATTPGGVNTPRHPKPQIDICRSCGATGMVEPDLDPAPGVCPRCLNRRLADVMGRAVVLAMVLDPGPLDAWLREALARSGVVEPFISYFVNGRHDMLEAVRREALRREGT